MPHFLNSVAPPLPHQDPFSRSPLPRFVAGQTRLLASSSCRAVVCPCRWSVGEVGLGRGLQCQEPRAPMARVSGPVRRPGVAVVGGELRDQTDPP